MSAEKRPLQTLLACIILIPLIWFALGWRFNDVVATDDALAIFIPQMRELLRAGGDWTQTLYTPQVQGGAKIHDVVGTLPIFQLLAWLDVSLASAVNITIFFTQLLYSFFAVQIIFLLNYLIVTDNKQKRARSEKTALVFFVILTAFAPLLALKLSRGHWIMVLGSLFFICTITWILAINLKKLSITMSLLTVLALTHCFPSAGQQMILYSMIFGLPITLGYIFLFETSTWGKNKRAVLIFAILLLISIFLSLPKLSGMIKHAFGDDASRGLGGGSIVYSYIISSFDDWFSSLPWRSSVMPPDRTANILHETNFAFGPLFLLLILLPLKRFKYLLVGLALSLVLAVSFSLNLAPGNLLLDVVPPLHDFRVPGRAMIPFSLALIPLALSVFYVKVQRFHLFFILPLLPAIYFVPAELQEVLVWILTVVFVFSTLLQVKKPIHAVILLSALTAVSVASFKDRLKPFVPLEKELAAISNVEDDLKNRHESLKSPQVRAVAKNTSPLFDNNLTWLMNLSSINGYWFPLKRYTLLVTSLQQGPYNPMISNFHLVEGNLTFDTLCVLYNVRYSFEVTKDKLESHPIAQQAKPAWFSKSVRTVASADLVARWLLTAGDVLSKQLQEEQFVLSSDIRMVNQEYPACAAARVVSVENGKGNEIVRIRTESPDTCPLTIGLNYSEVLRAVVIRGPTQVQKLPIYPVYVALTGLLAPKGSSEIIIEASPYVPVFAKVAFYLALLLLLPFAIFLLFRLKNS